GAVELVRQAKKDGQAVTAEVSPHHLLLTEEACVTYDSHFKMNPPLRTKADAEACIAGVVDGTIDCLATDHAPHTREEKELEFDKAPFGIVGLETALGLYAKALVEPGI
ncbi:MAG: dihydroorotase, partial [Phycisphaerales bacterium]|nr:dihydroorotase [Phycisphaerales bacterium]